MKRILLMLFILIANLSFAQIDKKYEISTMRIGTLKVGMTKSEVEAIAGKKMIMPDSTNDYNGKNKVLIDGNIFEIEFSIMDSEGELYSISTINSVYKTKSGMGVGSTRDQLINAYKNYSAFSVYPVYDEKLEGFSKTQSYFVLRDYDASTQLMFRLVNGKVVEVIVQFEEEGC